MQKKLIALAVAGMVAAPVAMAQSNVTIYGLVDLGLTYEKAGGNKFTGVENITAGSRIGFRGTEDLGNGLKAVFTLEYGIDPDFNSGIANSRQSFVGLQGGFGFVGLGRQYSPGFFMAGYDASASALFGPHQILAHRTTTRIASSGRARIDNAINYKSPNFNGLSFNAIYGFNEVNQAENRRRGDLGAVGATYANGPLNVGLIYSTTNRSGLVGSNQKEWFIGGAYNFGVVKILGSYQHNKISDTDKLWQIGITAPVGAAGTVALAHGRLDHGAGTDFDANSTSINYLHNLSKRTTAYVGMWHVNNKDAQAASMLARGATGVAGSNSRGFTAGLRHVF